MLAYVFWHWRRAPVARERYEALQRAFHAALRAAPPPGFLGSRSAAIAGTPWAAASGEAYEDWYLVEGSAALDPLNEAAVTATRQLAHDAAAAAAEGGTAGLYRLRLGGGENQGHGVLQAAAWLGKPAGWSYAEFHAALEPLVRETGGVLWGRQMTLGPAPEFCLQTSRAVRLPEPFVAQAVALRPIWP
ncbi:MAG: hypothetical protein ACREMO_06500 [Gemmatimonadales bacterium]